MAFLPRSFYEITTELVAWLVGSPEAGAAAPDMDLTEGSIERSHLEALAVQLEELEVRSAAGIADGIRESCYRAFGVDLLAPAAASGAVVFSALVAPGLVVSIPSGTRVMGPGGQVFATTANANLGVGALTTAPVPIQAIAAGADGNVPAASITRIVGSISGIDRVTNPNPTVGGTEEETDAARAERFKAYVQTLQHGTAAALEFGALTVPGVLEARAIEPGLMDPRPLGVPFSGLVWLFVDDGQGLTPTTKTAVEAVTNGYVDGSSVRVPGWKAAGVRVDVLPVAFAEVRVRGTVRLRPGGGARWDAIKTALTATAAFYFSNLKIGDPVSYQVLSAALNNTDPDVAEVNLYLWLTGDVAPDYGSTPVAGDVSPVNEADPYTIGARCTLCLATGYPEWVIA